MKGILRITIVFTLAGFFVSLGSCMSNAEPTLLQARIDSLKKELKKYRDEKAMIEKRLRRFDSLDFQFYNTQQWDSFAISHDSNIKVFYPDGNITTGLYPEHKDMLTPMFTFAPDTKIRDHIVSLGNDEWTAVIGEMDGTFSKPMKMGNKTIPPTGKKFKLRMATISKWKNGKMIEEHLFWDNQALMTQIMPAKQPLAAR